MYAQAREAAIPLLEDRAMSIAINPQPGYVKVRRQVLDKDGSVVEVEEIREQDAVERSRLALSAYQWVLGWRAPKKHGKQADPEAGKPNAQLTALFDSLKSGPKE